MKKIIFVLLALVLSSCATTPIEKDCTSKTIGELGYGDCKEYANKETLKEYGITDGTDCLDYALQEEKKWTGTHMSYVRTLIKLKINSAISECKKKVKEKKNDCQAKVDSCVETSTATTATP